MKIKIKDELYFVIGALDLEYNGQKYKLGITANGLDMQKVGADVHAIIDIESEVERAAALIDIYIKNKKENENEEG